MESRLSAIWRGSWGLLDQDLEVRALLGSECLVEAEVVAWMLRAGGPVVDAEAAALRFGDLLSEGLATKELVKGLHFQTLLVLQAVLFLPF